MTLHRIAATLLFATSAYAVSAQNDPSEQEAISTIVVFSMLPLILSFSFIFFIFFRKRREDESRRLQAESEMKALRAQMNPHFIFNSLNSIYMCIIQDKKQEAGDYLISFSKLMRQTLEFTRHPLIPLEDELDCLKLYMDLEGLRKPFDYVIDIDQSVDLCAVFIPPLLLQPFVENSIVHGFRDKLDKGQIKVEARADQKSLTCVITDNGVVPASPEPGIRKKESLGTVIVNERLEAIRRAGTGEAKVFTEPLLGPDSEYIGCRVTLILPLYD